MRGATGIFRLSIVQAAASGRGMGRFMLLCCLGGGHTASAWANPVLGSTDIQPLSVENNPSAFSNISLPEALAASAPELNGHEHYTDIRKYSTGFRNASHFIQIIDENCNDSGLCLRVPWYLSFSNTAARWAYEKRGVPDILEKIYAVSVNSLSARNPYLSETALDEDPRSPGPAGSGTTPHGAKLAIKGLPLASPT